MLKVLILGALSGCGPVAACLPTPPAATALPVCEENFGPGVVQVKWENDLGCDLVPPVSLTVVIDERSWAEHSGSAEGWGGDGSLAWADQECADGGGKAVWHDGQWLECQDVDY